MTSSTHKGWRYDAANDRLDMLFNGTRIASIDASNGLVIASGGSAVTGAITATTTITAATGLVATTGGVTATAGGVTITAGGLLVTAGGIDAQDQDYTTGATTGATIGAVGGACGCKLGFWNATPVVQPGHIADATACTVVAQVNLILADLAELGLQAAV